MKIVVIGGSGLIGSKLVTRLRDWGHEALAASPASDGIKVTCQGLAAEVGHHPPLTPASPRSASMTGLHPSAIGNGKAAHCECIHR